MLYLYGHRYYPNSYGIRCEYELVRTLNEQGLEARLLYGGHSYEDECVLPPMQFDSFCIDISNETVKLEDQDVVIYTEADDNNPMESPNVIRWLLNKPLINRAKLQGFGDNDVLAAYSKYIDNDLPQLFYLVDEKKFLKSIRNKATHDEKQVCLYFGKYNNDIVRSKAHIIRELIDKYESVVVITRDYPKSRKETLLQIANSDLLISTDPLTNVNYEACLLGTPVLLVDDTYDTEHREFNVRNSGVCYDVANISSIQATINGVYDDYCTFLEQQPQRVVNEIKELVNRCIQMRENPDALEKNRIINKTKKEDYIKYYNTMCNSKPMGYIATFFDIPSKTQKEMGLKSFKRRAFYIKTWKNLLYTTASSELLFSQLLYLTIRRPFVKRMCYQNE